MLKAYIVQEEEEMTGGVVYAKTNAQARRIGANEWNAGEFHGVTCHRAPAFDGLENDPRARTRLLLEQGWWFHTPDDLDVLTTDDAPFVTRAGDVHRSPYAWLAHRETKIRERAFRERERAAWLSRLWGRWWFADAIHVHVGPRGFVDAHVRLPHLLDGLRVRRERGRTVHTVSLRDLPVYQQAYRINQDGEFFAP